MPEKQVPASISDISRIAFGETSGALYLDGRKMIPAEEPKPAAPAPVRGFGPKLPGV